MIFLWIRLADNERRALQVDVVIYLPSSITRFKSQENCVRYDKEGKVKWNLSNIRAWNICTEGVLPLRTHRTCEENLATHRSTLESPWNVYKTVSRPIHLFPLSPLDTFANQPFPIDKLLHLLVHIIEHKFYPWKSITSLRMWKRVFFFVSSHASCG